MSLYTLIYNGQTLKKKKAFLEKIEITNQLIILDDAKYT